MSEMRTAESSVQRLLTIWLIHLRFLSRFAAVGVMIALAARIEAQDTAGGPERDDDTLQFYLGKSAIVIVGEFTSEPFGYTTELGAVQYSAEFRIDEVLKGRYHSKETISVSILRTNWGSIREKSDRDRPAELTLGGKCILFLDVHRQTADIWFGVQPAYPSMIHSLKRLVANDVPK